MPLAASRAASSTASCWGNVCVRSRGGNRMPSSETATSVRGSLEPRPANKATARSRALSPWPTRAPTETIAMGSRRRLAGAAIEARNASGLSPSQASTMRWALLPPKPNALMAARLGPVQGSSSVSTRNDVPVSAGFFTSAESEAGRTPASIAARTLSSPAVPAAVIRWPRFDFSEPTGKSPQSAKTSAVLRTSVPSPTGVPVA